jgi:outer membrane biosynthesis protein TonB
MNILAVLLLAIPSSNAPGEPRACRDSVSVVSDASVERVGPPGSDSLVRWLPRSRGPEFPRELRSLHQGSVLARFVVDTSGRVIKGTAVIISESDRGFGRSVCQFLENQARFNVRPVEGQKARIEVRNASFRFQIGQ